MATESSEGEEEGKITGGNKHLVIEDDLREMGKKAAWSVSSCKPGNGVSSLRDDNLDTYWQLTNIPFCLSVYLIKFESLLKEEMKVWVSEYKVWILFICLLF